MCLSSVHISQSYRSDSGPESKTKRSGDRNVACGEALMISTGSGAQTRCGAVVTETSSDFLGPLESDDPRPVSLRTVLLRLPNAVTF